MKDLRHKEWLLLTMSAALSPVAFPVTLTMHGSKNCYPITEKKAATQGGQVWYFSLGSDRAHASICVL